MFEKMPIRSVALALALSAVFFLITATTFSSLGVVLPAMIGDFGWNWGTAGLGFTTLALFTGIFSPIAASSLERLGPGAHYFLGGAVMCAGYMLLGATTGVTTYLIATALLGAGFALLANVAGTYLVGRAVPKKWRSLAIGAYLAAGGAGGVFGPLIANAMIEDGSNWRGYWRFAAVMVAVASALIVPLSNRRLAGVADDEAATAIADKATNSEWLPRKAMLTPAFGIIAAALMVAYFCGVTVSTWSVAHLQNAGLASGVAVAMLSLYSGVNALARAAGGVLARHIDPRHLLIAALLANVVGMTALALGNSLHVAMLFAIFDGFAFGMALFATTALLIDYFGLKNSPALLGGANLIATVAMLGPTLAGQTADRWGSFAPIFLIYAVGALAAAGAVWMIRSPNDAPSKDGIVA
jgi:MFS family permease